MLCETTTSNLKSRSAACVESHEFWLSNQYCLRGLGGERFAFLETALSVFCHMRLDRFAPYFEIFSIQFFYGVRNGFNL